MIASLRSQTNHPKTIMRWLSSVALLAALLSGIDVSAQFADNYTLTQAQTSVTTGLTGAQTLFSGAGDDGVAVIDLTTANTLMGANPFVFSFAGNPVGNSIFVSCNGFVTFGSAPSATNSSPISSAEGYTGAIAAYGFDLKYVLATNGVTYAVQGTYPDRTLKIRWHARRTTVTSETATFISVLTLSENGNTIRLEYGTFGATGGATNLMGGQIGLRGATASDFINFTHASGQWPTPLVGMPAGSGNTAFVNTGLGAQILASSAKNFLWTPNTCAAPNGLATTTVGDTYANFSWNPAGSAVNGYDYYYNTTGVAPTGATTPSGSVGAGVTTLNLSPLAPSTTYHVWVRSRCAAGATSGWTSAVTFTTYCAFATVPYYRDFEGPVVSGFAPFHGTVPACTSTVQAGSGNLWVTSSANNYGNSGMDGNILMYNGQSPANGNPANTWFFTEGITLAAGNYTISYLFGGTNTPSTVNNRMRVAYGTSPTAAAMTGNILDNHPDIKGGPFQNYVNFTVATPGVYFFGLNAYSLQNMGQLYVDDLSIGLNTTCLKPAGVTVANVGGSSAQVFWTAPTPAPANGYVYYVSTSATPPANNTTPTGSVSGNTVTLTGLTGNTTYYVWVRTRCWPGAFGEWVAGPSFTTTNAPTYCVPAPTSVDGTGITNVTFGAINNSSTDVAGNSYGNYSHLVTDVNQGATVPMSVTFTTNNYSYDTKVWVDWNNDGDFNDALEEVYSGSTLTPTPYVLNLTFNVPTTVTNGAVTTNTLGEHRLRIGGADLVTPTPCYSGTWAAFEDYTIRVVTPPPALTLSVNSDVQCAGNTSVEVDITQGLSDYQVFSWSPNVGVSGDTSGYFFNPSATVTYTLTAIQTSAPYRTNQVTFTYNANPVPTPIVISPATPSVCQGAAPVALTATGGIISGINLVDQNFNSGISWPAPVNLSTGFNPAGAAWTVRPSGYNPAGATLTGPIVSPDSSSFYLSNSDAQASGSQTDAYLLSETFSLVGATDASLSFDHFYKAWINGFARVEIYSGGAWVQLINWGASGNTQGSPTAFAHQVISLAPYVGQANLQIRFRYYTSWGYVWAIDNFKITRTGSSDVTWSPIGGLYSDAAGTVPYVANTPTATVYAAPTSTQVYTATAQTFAPVCVTSAQVAVSVNPIQVGAVTPATQTACGQATALTLNTASTTGTVTMWQYSTSPTFATAVTDIPSSASATLTPAQIGAFAGIRYYRAVVSNPPCTAYSAIVSISFDSKIWNGTSWSPGGAPPTSSQTAIFQGNYTQLPGTTLNACSVRVESGNVVFDVGSNLIVQNNVTRIGGTLTFENNASLVQVDNAAVNSGYIIYKRDAQPMIQYDYTYWSSPLSPQTLVGLSPNTASDKYFAYDPMVDNYVNVNANTIMDPGRGYIVRAPQSYNATAQIYHAVFNGGTANGVPNNGIVNINIVSPWPESYNLIGNPYPSALDADLFYQQNSSLIDGNFYFWTHNTAIDPLNYTQSDYAVWNSTGGSGAAGGGIGNSNVPDGMIAAGQGFFVVGDVPTPVPGGTPLVFNNSMRAAGNNGIFFRPDGSQRIASVVEKHRVWLDVTNSQGAYKQALVGYVSGATNAKEKAFDAATLDGGNTVNFYSIVGPDKLTIQGRALPFDVNDQVPMGFSSQSAGGYTISLSNFDGLFDNQDVYLEDKYLNVIHNLKQANYTFTTAAGVFEDRFILRYNDTMLSNPGHEFNDNAVVIYKGDNGVNINSGVIAMENVKVFDMRGRLVTEKSAINATQTVIALDVPQQVLIVQVTADDKMVTKKIVY